MAITSKITSKIILVVDDQIDNFDTLENLLTDEGLQLVYASSGSKAFSLLENMKADLILLDVMMPEMDGIEVCRLLKKDERYKHIPILIVTALKTTTALARCLEEGADDFISKPFDSVELRARVYSLLRIKAQYDKLQNLIQLREDLTNMIVHDLRNPLAGILLGVTIAQQYLNRGHSLDKVSNKLSQIANAGQRMQNMIDNLLLVAKLESGKLLLNPVTIDLHELGTKIIDDFEPLASISMIKLVGELPPPGNHVEIDVTILQRVIENLISNAFKFSPPDSQVILTLEYLGENHVQIKVADRGSGISQVEQKQIFEKFETGEFKKNIPQIGLGLAFCKLAVEAHGGTLAIAPNQPQGSIFTVEI